MQEEKLSASNATRFSDYRSNLRESRLRKVADWIEALPPGRMLDIGCSAGVFGAPWQTRGWAVHGLEIAPGQVEKARAAGIRVGEHDLAKYPYPLDASSFDLLFAGEVIEHLVDTDGFLIECARLLRPGGTLILTTPNLASFENRLRLLLGLYPIWVDYSLKGEGHVRCYTPAVLKRQLSLHGFEVQEHRGNWVPFLPQKFIDDLRAPWLAATGDWFPNLSMGILLSARLR